MSKWQKLCTFMWMSPRSSQRKVLKVSRSDLVELLTWIFSAGEGKVTLSIVCTITQSKVSHKYARVKAVARSCNINHVAFHDILLIYCQHILHEWSYVIHMSPSWKPCSQCLQINSSVAFSDPQPLWRKALYNKQCDFFMILHSSLTSSSFNKHISDKVSSIPVIVVWIAWLNHFFNDGVM